MIGFEKALEILLETVHLLGSERVDITEAAGRILADDVKSDIDIPPFNKSAMDGFACRRADLGNELTVIETIAAGFASTKTIGKNQCVKIMTGGMVPDGGDCVIMKEYVESVTGNTIRFVAEKTSDNICSKGEDVKAGVVVLHKGTMIKPQHISVLASVGNTHPLVSRRPRIGVIATGNELVELGSKLGPAQIRNSNTFQIIEQVKNTGAIAVDYGITKDNADEIDKILKKAISENDVIIVSGGVSVGDFDFVPDMLKKNNVELLFEKIAIKPGKPTVFGLSEKGYCFGLPGNPVSSFVLFELLVKPFIYKLMGHNYKPLNIQIELGESLVSKKAKRQRWFPVLITDKGTARPVEYHGSAHINALCGADGLVSMDIGVEEIKKGNFVSVRLI